MIALLCLASHIVAVDAPRLVTQQTLGSPQRLAVLERPGEVLFRDNFNDEASLSAYFEVRGKSERNVAVDYGTLKVTAPNNDGRSSGAGVSYWFGDRPQTRAHLRYRMKWSDTYNQGNLNHTGGGMAGLATNGKWDEMGKAGIRPSGEDRMSVGVDSWVNWGRIPAPGFIFCYTYWMDMQIDRDGHYWGNFLGAEESGRFVPKRGEWVWVELMVKLNEVGKLNGELALWTNGKLNFHYEGIRWRKSEKLLLKRMGLDVYIHESGQDNTAWYDDVVLSTGYVGIPKSESH